jgi:two-component system sensor histidine kinase QseC
MSIRTRLFVILFAATGAIWLSAFLWIQHSTRAEVERVLDARLAEAARMVASLVADHRIDTQAPTLSTPRDTGAASNAILGAHDYARQISCQIWQFDGALIGRSRGAPEARLTEAGAGFSNSLVDGEAWRVYTVVDATTGARVMVGDRLTVRQKLARDVTTGLVLPAITILPILAGLIWLALARGLAPLERLAAGLATRGPNDLTPLPEAPAPREIRPVAHALNGLITRVAAAREAERSFVAYAAHELKTPLAGIRTQAQIAARAPDAETRDRALAQLGRGVARTDRLVIQLLDLARIETAEPPPSDAPQPIARLIEEVIGDLAPLARSRGVVVRATGRTEAGIGATRIFLQLALRNLLENATQASPSGAEVEIRAHDTPEGPVIEVRDQGGGIAPADRPRVMERFFRGAGATGAGSGLGLAIVEIAARRLDADFTLAPGAENVGTLATLRLRAAPAPGAA